MACFARIILCIEDFLHLILIYYYAVQGLGENAFLYELLEKVTLNTEFTDSNDFSSQLETVAKMMKTKDGRGTDRDIFYVELPGFDTHADFNRRFGILLQSVNLGIQEFRNAMIDEGLWDSVTVVMVSEFGRTLKENTGGGSDHGKQPTQ